MNFDSRLLAEINNSIAGKILTPVYDKKEMSRNAKGSKVMTYNRTEIDSSLQVTY